MKRFWSLLFLIPVFLLINHCNGDNSSSTYTDLPIAVLHSFSGYDGANGKGSLVLGANVLYGRMAFGGTNNSGVIFKINTDASGFEVLYSFTSGADNETGFEPHHSSMELQGNILYGSAVFGGNSDDHHKQGNGVIYSIATNGNNYTVLHEFTGSTTDGSNPHSCVLLINDTLYGMTALGGEHDKGVLYQMNTDGSNFQILHSFDGDMGEEPHGIPVMGSDGVTLYGLTRKGGSSDVGTVFAFNTSTSSYTVLHSFKGGMNDGSLPFHGNLWLNEGTLYGLTAAGGSADQGVIFSIKESGNNFQLLHSFGTSAQDGAQPYGSLVLSNGYLYGTARLGGFWNNGIIFRIQPDGNNYRRLTSFEGAVNGATPIDNVTFSEDGRTLYGITQFGGVNDLFLENQYGTIFSMQVP